MRALLLPALLLLPVLCHAAPAASLRELIEHFTADRSLFARHWEITGDSKAAMDREEQMLKGWLNKLKELEFDSLRAPDKIDWILLRNELEASLAHLREHREETEELAAWLPFRAAIDGLTDARVRGNPLHAETAAGELAPLAKQIGEWQQKLKPEKPEKHNPEDKSKPAQAGNKPGESSDSPGSSAADAAAPRQPANQEDGAAAAEDPPSSKDLAAPTRHQALLAAEATEAAAQSLKSWHANYSGFVPEFGWWIEKPYEETAKAMEQYAKFLREELAGIKDKDDPPLLGKPIGAEALQEHLQHEFVPYTARELLAIGEREFAWCEEQMKAAARAMKLGDDWKKALLRVKLQYVKPGEQEMLVRHEVQRAAAFVKKHNLVTVPADCEQWWGTRMLNAQEQKQIPYAAYSGHDMLVAYASAAMKHDDKLMAMRGNNRPFTRTVVPHEVIPGHHLQSFMAARHRPYRRIFSTPFFVEGWALYWEMRLWDLGYHTTPEDRIGALFWRMHRCARIIVTLKFHLGEMTPDEMVKFLIDRVGHERFGATSEVRRFIKGDYSPLYQCAYMLGGLQLMALHRELVGSGRMSEQRFHDALLKLGPIPVEMLRASLLKTPLDATFKTQWRFDETTGKRD